MKRNPERFFSESSKTVFDATQAKILIGDFLSRFDKQCTADILREILTVNETVIAYFTYVEAFDEMTANSMIETTESGIVRLTSAGEQLVRELDKLVPKSLRDRALASGQEYFRRKKEDRDTDIRLVEQDGSFGARCECFDNGKTLMRITLWYPDRELADFMRSLMNFDPVGLYCDVLDRILGIKTQLVEFSAPTPMDETLLNGVQKFFEKHSDHVIECGSKALDKGFEVSCRCSDEQQLLMELDVFAPDEQQAEYLCKSISKDKMIFCLIERLVLQNLGRQDEL